MAVRFELLGGVWQKYNVAMEPRLELLQIINL